MEFVDTHCHLDDEAFEQDLPHVLDAARAAGVSRFVNIGYEPESWKRSILLAEANSDISFALGMHPNSADLWNSETSEQLKGLLSTNRPVAIGEIGLDFFREHADHDAQRTAFRDQLALAAEFDLPIVIHMRGDVESEIIGQLNDWPTVRVVLHSFDGTARLRDIVLDRGGYLGVGGLMTRQGSSQLRELLREVPLTSILLETDAPYLVPKGVKERRNSPSSIPVIAAFLAELLGVSTTDVARQTTENALRIFSLAATVPSGTSR
jgi:TatD DNase family protein